MKAGPPERALVQALLYASKPGQTPFPMTSQVDGACFSGVYRIVTQRRFVTGSVSPSLCFCACPSWPGAMCRSRLDLLANEKFFNISIYEMPVRFSVCSLAGTWGCAGRGARNDNIQEKS